MRFISLLGYFSKRAILVSGHLYQKLKDKLHNPFITGILGVILGSLLNSFLPALVSPAMAYHYQSTFTQKQEKEVLWKSINDNFTGYINYRERLNAMATSEESLSKEEKQNSGFYKIKDEYVMARNEFSRKLNADLLIAKRYFKKTAPLIDEYIAWDNKQRLLRVSQQLGDYIYAEWQTRIVDNIKTELDT